MFACSGSRSLFPPNDRGYCQLHGLYNISSRWWALWDKLVILLNIHKVRLREIYFTSVQPIIQLLLLFNFISSVLPCAHLQCFTLTNISPAFSAYSLALQVLTLLHFKLRFQLLSALTLQPTPSSHTLQMTFWVLSSPYTSTDTSTQCIHFN